MHDAISAPTTRRSLLLGLATASTAAAMPGAGMASESENPALIALGNTLPTIADECREAIAQKDAMVSEAEKHWPRAPETIKAAGIGSTREVNVEGAGYPRKSRIGIDTIFTREGIHERIAHERKCLAELEVAPRKKELREQHRRHIATLESIIPEVNAYWSKCERLQSSLNSEAVLSRASDAREALQAHVCKIMVERESSMQGVVIKAQALQAWEAAPLFFQVFNVEGPRWAQELADALMRQAGGVAHA